jgi:hypothetical protein
MHIITCYIIYYNLRIYHMISIQYGPLEEVRYFVHLFPSSNSEKIDYFKYIFPVFEFESRKIQLRGT